MRGRARVPSGPRNGWPTQPVGGAATPLTRPLSRRHGEPRYLSLPRSLAPPAQLAGRPAAPPWPTTPNGNISRPPHGCAAIPGSHQSWSRVMRSTDMPLIHRLGLVETNLIFATGDRSATARRVPGIRFCASARRRRRFSLPVKLRLPLPPRPLTTLRACAVGFEG